MFRYFRNICKWCKIKFYKTILYAIKDKTHYSKRKNNISIENERHILILGKSVFEISPDLSLLFMGSIIEYRRYDIEAGSVLSFSRDPDQQAQEVVQYPTVIHQYSD